MEEKPEILKRNYLNNKLLIIDEQNQMEELKKVNKTLNEINNQEINLKKQFLNKCNLKKSQKDED